MQLVIGPRGDIRTLYDETLSLAEFGPLTIRRASHVEPDEAGDWIADLAPVGARFTLSRAAATTSELNLYDYRDTNGNDVFGATDFQLVGVTHGPILGSLAIDPDDLGFTFVAVGGVLPPDDYTVTLRSAANGFRSAAGEILDGNFDNVPGSNFDSTFAWRPDENAVTVGIPSFARGPQQPVNVPALSTGLPVVVSNADRLLSASFTVRFNSQLLDVTQAVLASGLPAGSGVTFQTLSPVVVRVTLTFAGALPSGSRTVALLIAAVPLAASSRYGERGVIDVSDLLLLNDMGDSVPAIDSDAVHLNAYFGDLGRNGRYDSFDVQQASRVALRLDSGFQAHPLVDPGLVGDFNGNGRIDSFDVQRISRLALRLPVEEAPDAPSPLPPVTNTNRLTEEPPKSEPPKTDAAPRSDIDGNGAVDAQDVAWAVYYFNRSEDGVVPAEAIGKQLDLNGDNSFDAADVLLAIADLNAKSAAAEGEATITTAATNNSDDDLDTLTYLLAEDLVASRKKK